MIDVYEHLTTSIFLTKIYTLMVQLLLLFKRVILPDEKKGAQYEQYFMCQQQQLMDASADEDSSFICTANQVS